jgi:hypothetical protein
MLALPASGSPTGVATSHAATLSQNIRREMDLFSLVERDGEASKYINPEYSS